ncbi:MAG: hypothetical protein K2K51_06330 [Bacteroidales bacterium]|nr:hypothetical protein [Bacteroidales bacterium]
MKATAKSAKAVKPAAKRGRPSKSGATPKKSNKPKTKQRKLIDLPLEILPKLSVLAAKEGKSLKAYVEYLAIEKAKTVKDDKVPAVRRRK